MATLSVGGNTVFDGATLQSGVTFASGITFPAGHLIQSKEINIGGAYTSGNVKRTNESSNPPGTHVHADFDMTCSNIPQISNKIIKVQYNLFVSHDNHPQYFIVHSWDNSSWVKSPRGATTGAGANWGDANSQYPHGAGGYDSDNNNIQHIQCNAIWTDSTSSNTTLYTRLHWQSQNDTSNIYINRNVNHSTTHGAVTNSSGSIYIYQG
tara:strand:- start:664 stop:1290 length:627 start_codon:yes stop_codon:yes gene_type:complete